MKKLKKGRRKRRERMSKKKKKKKKRHIFGLAVFRTGFCDVFARGAEGVGNSNSRCAGKGEMVAEKNVPSPCHRTQ